MKNFPEKFNPNNQCKFNEYLYERNLCYLRKDIYEHILKKRDVNDYFSISQFDLTYNNNKDITYNMINSIIKELKDLGWECKLFYGNTGLFIYSETNKPEILNWGDEF